MRDEQIDLLVNGCILLVGADHVLGLSPQGVHGIELGTAFWQPEQTHAQACRPVLAKLAQCDSDFRPAASLPVIPDNVHARAANTPENPPRAGAGERESGGVRSRDSSHQTPPAWHSNPSAAPAPTARAATMSPATVETAANPFHLQPTTRCALASH